MSYTQQWLRGEGPEAHDHEGIRLEDRDGWIGVGHTYGEDQKTNQAIVQRVDNEGGTVWTFLEGDAHSTSGTQSYSVGYSVAQVSTLVL